MNHMENHFQSLIKQVFPDFTQQQVDNIRKIFMAGAASLVEEIAIANSLPDGLDSERLQMVFDEIHEFSLKMINL